MMRMRRFSNQHGFSLAELLVAVAVMTLLMAGVFVLQRGGQEAYLFGSNRVEAQQSTRVALDLMTRELRSATPTDPAGPAPTGILLIPSSTDITFRDQCGNNVQYSLAGTLLNRTGPNYSDRDSCVLNPSNPTGTTPLIGGVTTCPGWPAGKCFAMTYYTAASATTTNPKQVAVIKVSIRTQTDESVDTGHATMESTIKLRATLS
jgi:prepilin-type N-terminal cleavage/methylation domain-containing protein